MSGRLSQAAVNLEAAEQQIVTLGGLPPAAQQIQEVAEIVVSPIISDVQMIQKAAGNFAQTALPELNNVETMISDDQPLSSIKATIASVQNEANTLKSSVDATLTQINSNIATTMNCFDQLAIIESDLTKQMTSLQGQLGNAQCEEEAAKKKYYYLIALGPFGLIGLAVALGLYLQWQSDVNGYECQISSLNAQINIFNTMKSTCQLMVTDFQEIVTRVFDIRNAVDLIAGDILSIDSDLDAGNALLVIKIKVQAAIAEINALGTDAS